MEQRLFTLLKTVKTAFQLLSILYLTVQFAIPRTVASEGFPLQDCRAGNWDVVVFTDEISDIYKLRLETIVNYFTTNLHHDLVRLSVSLFLPEAETPIIEFNRYNISGGKLNSNRSYVKDHFDNSTTFKHQLNGLKHMQVKNVKLNANYFTHGINYLKTLKISPRNRNRLMIVLYKYSDSDRFFGPGFEFTSITTYLKSEGTQVFFIFITDLPFSDWSLLKHTNVVFIDLADDLAHNQHFSMLLYGQCLPGWFGYSSQVNAAKLSCYKLEISESYTSHILASTHCADMSSRLVAIEEKEELDFLTKRIASDYTKINGSANSFLVHVGIYKKTSQHVRYEWENRRPVLLEDILEICSPDPVLAVEIFPDKNSSLQENAYNRWTTMSFVSDLTKMSVCELDMSDRLLLGAKSLEMNDTKNLFVHSKVITFDGVSSRGLGSGRNELIKLFDCKYMNEFLPYLYVCDGFSDCTNAQDEVMCRKEGPVDTFTRTFIFVPKINSDCLEILCEDQICLPRQWFKNSSGISDLNLRQNNRIWKDITKLVNTCFRGCGVENCSHNDEPNDAKAVCGNQNEVLSLSFQERQSKKIVWAPRCIHLKSFTGKRLGCSDLSHLKDCQDFICVEGLYKCHLSYCIPLYMVNDGTMDCPFGDDELTMDVLSQVDTYGCRGSVIRIDVTHVCDGVPHCLTGDDELNCHNTCPSGFWCQWGVATVVDLSKVNNTELFDSFDPNVRVVNLSEIDLYHVVVPRQLNLQKVLELYISNCNLSNSLLANILLALGNGLKHTKVVDLSHNNIDQLELTYLPKVNDLKLSRTQFKKIIISSEHLKDNFKLDLTFTKMEEFQVNITKHDLEVHFYNLNLSHTSFHSLNTLRNVSKIGILDLRNTIVKYDQQVGSFLGSLKIEQGIYGDSFKLCCKKFKGQGIPDHTCFAPKDAISSCDDLLGDVIKRVMLWVVAAGGGVGNLVVIVYRVVFELKEMKHGNKLFVTNLGLSDIVMGVYLIIIAGSDVYHRDNYVIYESQWRESSLCTAAGFLLTLSCVTSTMFILLITLDRYLIFKNPLRPCKIPLVGLVASVVAVWVIGLVLAILPVLYPEWQIYSSNGMCLGIPVNMKRSTGWTYSFLVFIVFNFLQLIFIITGQIAIFKSIALSSDSQINSSTHRRREMTVAKNVSLIVLSKFFCWFPVSVIGLMSACGHTFSPETHGWLAICVIPLNSAVNPVLYTLPAVYQKWLTFYRGKLIAPKENYNRNAAK